MTKHEELIEKVARVLCREVMGIEYDAMSESVSYLERKSNTEAAILDKQEAREISSLIVSTILTALQEPTSEMIIAGGNYVLSVGSIDCMHVDDRPEYGMTGRETGSYALFQAMLNASPLAGEKRGAE